MEQRFDHFAAQLDDLKRSGRHRRLTKRSPDGIRFVESGRTVINFGSNDYLGLASEHSATPSTRGGSGASALVCGWTDDHQKLADTIADLEQTEAAVVFPSGFAACSGVAATLPGPRDLILSDQLNHASLIDGCRLSRAICVVYPHRDVDFIAATLSDRRDEFDHVWIITDGVFSMDGHVAPLVGLCNVADRFAATVIVDEAHATGVLGDSGSGTCEALDVKHRVAIRVGTLSKAVGGQGGFVAGPSVVIDYLINRCRSLIYSTSLSPAAVAIAQANLNQITFDDSRRVRVRDQSVRLRKLLSIEADDVESTVPIVPLIIGDDQRAIAASKRLFDAGFYVPAIRPPTVPEGTARLRISLSAEHSDEMIDLLVTRLTT